MVAFLAPSKLAITVPLGGWEDKTTPKPVEIDISIRQNHNVMRSYYDTELDGLATDCIMYDSIMAVIDYHC